MAGQIVYTDLAEGAGIAGQLFAGKQFWLAQRIPSRTRYVELIRNNGGKVISLEKKADYLIADHCRRDCPPGSISYTFIDQSIRDGHSANPDEHTAGPPLGTAREVGSISRPARGSRAAYTAEEDRILYKWVRDHDKGRSSASGNEIYKQLEAKYPRHTWQSWRDRYIKQLRDRPPAGLNIPENAPPSPPSDQSAEQNVHDPRKPSTNRTGKKSTQGAAGQPAAEVKPGDANRQKQRESYTVQDFDKLFTKEDWEELYGNVQTILATSTEGYIEGWENWAEGTSQTAEQWRQYFEKVVRPQWHKDTPRKQEAIKDKVWQKHENGQEAEDGGEDNVEGISAGPSTPTKHSTPSVVIARDDMDAFNELYSEMQMKRKGKDASEAYMFWAREEKHKLWQERPGLDYTGLHRILKPRWNALTKEQQAPYLLKEAADKRRYDSERGFPSESSTAIQETPQYIRRSHERIMKRIRNEESDPFSGESEPSRSGKRRRSEESSPERGAEHMDLPGPQQQLNEIIEISSGESSSLAQSSTGGPSSLKPLTQGSTVDEAIQAELQEQVSTEVEEEDEVTGQTPVPKTTNLRYPRLPSDSPTPRAPRLKTSAFDTQAILSSPSQAFPIAPLPRPPPLSETQSENDSSRESSPGAQQESVASTTHSLHEFRQSLNEASREGAEASIAITQAFEPLPLPSRSSSVVPSETDSVGSGDPDPPLNPSEMEDFFKEQHEQGFTDEEITEALRHTRCRPGLAMQVLDAWKDGEKLPTARGIWGTEDDEDVEGGDGAALARLERLHTCDGWGGITERLRFLQTWRGAE